MHTSYWFIAPIETGRREPLEYKDGGTGRVDAEHQD